jgi:acyl-coenzyme A thioesterase 9
MVALDPLSLKPLSRVGKALPALVLETTGDNYRLELANLHEQIRNDRASKAMQLRQKVSAPPSFDEMQALHLLHRQRALCREQAASHQLEEACLPELPTVQEYTFRSSRVIFPEQRNVHGKLFGGFVMSEAQSLAQYTATFFGMGQPIVPMGIDEAIFLQPVALGDLVTFTARLVHATATTCRVTVTVEVRDPKAPSTVPKRSNRLLFVFGGDFSSRPGIIPETYQEILMHMDARRRHLVEGPFEDEVKDIIQMSGNSIL